MKFQNPNVTLIDSKGEPIMSVEKAEYHRVLTDAELQYFGKRGPIILPIVFTPDKETIKAAKLEYKHLKNDTKRYQHQLGEIVSTFAHSKAPKWGALKMNLRHQSTVIKLSI